MSRLWMVCYDVEDDKRRLRIAKVLEAYGERVQYSVFECHLSPRQFTTLRQRLTDEMDKDADNVRWYPVCPWCRERVTWVGQGADTEDPPYIMV